MLLTKHSSWHYEDEVRVVKYISTDPDLQTRYQSDDNTKHLLINNNKTLLFNYNAEIKEVYLGLNNPLFGNIKPSENKILFDKAKAGNWSVYVAQMAKESWDLTRHELGQALCSYQTNTHPYCYSLLIYNQMPYLKCSDF